MKNRWFVSRDEYDRATQFHHDLHMDAHAKWAVLFRQHRACREALALLWEIARTPRAYTQDGERLVMALPAETLDRIDRTIGYDEMGD